MHFRPWLDRLKSWFLAARQRWWVLLLFFLYKVGEDRILGEINDQLEGRSGPIFAAARWVVDVVPSFTLWVLIPATFAYLLWRSYSDSRPVPAAEVAPAKPRRVTLEHDGVEWEYAGRRTDPRGPFCPDDHTPLAFVNLRNSGPGPKVVAYFNHDAAHLDGYWGLLRCLHCEKEYGSDWAYKTVEQSKREARRQFEGMENRGEV